MCLKCHSYIPLNQEKCIVCEEPIASRPHQIATVRMKVRKTYLLLTMYGLIKVLCKVL